MENKYASVRLIDGKPRKVIVDENGNIINKNPNKEELKYLEKESYSRNKILKKYNETNTCDICRDNGRVIMLTSENARQERDKNGKPTGRWTCDICYSIYDRYGTYEKPEKYYNETNTCSRCIEESMITKLYPGNAFRERDKEGKETWRWICRHHHDKDYQKYNPTSIQNIMKSMAGSRTGSLDPNSSKGKGDKYQLLAYKREGWIDLNKKNDNYTSGTPIDSYDPKTGLYHQIQGRFYISEHRYWFFTHLENEWFKEYEDMTCYCASKDGKIIKRKYRFPSWVIIGKKAIAIISDPTDRWGNHITPWYEKYRIIDEEELKNDNEVWQNIIRE